MDQKEIIFDESELGDLNALAARLFSDEHDPRSSGYKRVHFRPSICWWKIGLWVLGALASAACLGCGCTRLGLETGLSVLLSAALLLAACLIRGKAIVVTLVRIYQRYAPDSIRGKCRFEPSCSQYMILAVNKYGLFRGVRKGIDRLGRCNIHNGGYDEP